jgi:hypothetical protein
MPGVHGRIFISYRRDDAPFAAGRLKDRLEERFPGASIFMDVEAIEPGADFPTSIDEAVGSCDVLLALIGPRWLTLISRDEPGHRQIGDQDDFVALEIATALNRNIPVIPILIDGASMPRQGDLPRRLVGLARRNAVRLDHETFRTDIERILSAIDRVFEAAPQAGSASRSIPTTQPNASSSPTSTQRPSVIQPPSQRPLIPDRTKYGASDSAPTMSQPHIDKEQGGTFAFRSAFRVALWWSLWILTFITSYTVASAIRSSNDFVGPAISMIVLIGLIVGLAFVLRWQIREDRSFLDAAGFSRRDPLRRSSSSSHVRRVTILCVASSIVLGLAEALVSR